MEKSKEKPWVVANESGGKKGSKSVKERRKEESRTPYWKRKKMWLIVKSTVRESRKLGNRDPLGAKEKWLDTYGIMARRVWKEGRNRSGKAKRKGKRGRKERKTRFQDPKRVDLTKSRLREQ